MENTITTTYEVEGTTLKEIKTPTQIEPEITTYNIYEIQEEISKRRSAIARLESEIAPYQIILDKYNEIVPISDEVIGE